MSHFFAIVWSVFVFIVMVLVILRFFRACDTLDEMNRTLQFLANHIKDVRQKVSATTPQSPPEQPHA